MQIMQEGCKIGIICTKFTQSMYKNGLKKNKD